MSHTMHAIPKLPTPDWAQIFQVDIQENNEPLVKIDPHDRLFCRAFYYDSGIDGALDAIYLRENVAKKLHLAAAYLPGDYVLMVLDGYRPYAVQMALRSSIAAVLKAQSPDLSDDDFLRHLNEFIAVPSRDPKAPSPHLTGGSVDVALCDRAGNMLDMGTPFDGPEIDSWTAAFEGREGEIRIRRRILFNAMTNAGFTNLPTEWWHFDFGNQLWAHYSGQTQAVYSAIEGV